jgi:formyltetrahydrofolate synthetase
VKVTEAGFMDDAGLEQDAFCNYVSDIVPLEPDAVAL